MGPPSKPSGFGLTEARMVKSLKGVGTWWP